MKIHQTSVMMSTKKAPILAAFSRFFLSKHRKLEGKILLFTVKPVLNDNSPNLCITEKAWRTKKEPIWWLSQMKSSFTLSCLLRRGTADHLPSKFLYGVTGDNQ